MQRLDALPSSAYGLGGFAIKAALGRWLQGLGELPSVYAETSVVPGQGQSELVFEVRVGLQ